MGEGRGGVISSLPLPPPQRNWTFQSHFLPRVPRFVDFCSLHFLFMFTRNELRYYCLVTISNVSYHFENYVTYISSFLAFQTLSLKSRDVGHTYEKLCSFRHKNNTDICFYLVNSQCGSLTWRRFVWSAILEKRAHKIHNFWILGGKLALASNHCSKYLCSLHCM